MSWLYRNQVEPCRSLKPRCMIKHTAVATKTRFKDFCLRRFDRTTRKRWCEIAKWFLFSEQKILYISLSNHNAKRVVFVCPNRPAKSNLGRTPSVQIEKTARCQSLGLHCMIILSCEGDCSPMSKLNLGKYRQPTKPIDKCKRVPFPCGPGRFCQATPSMSTVRRPHRQHSAMR